MASLERKIEAEQRIRELLENGDLPQPDEIEHGEECIRLSFYETKVVVIVELE